MNSIIKLVLKRSALGLLTLIVVSLLIFLGVEALPGDLAETILGMEATPETVAVFRAELNLDAPGYERYFNWLSGMVKGDFGNSLSNQRPINEQISWRLSNTLFLAVSASIICVPLSLILGIVSALYRNSIFDRMTSIISLSAISFPEFFIAYILIALLSVKFSFFPSMTTFTDGMPLWEKLYEITLPCLTLTFVVLAHMMRMTRAAIINVLSSPYIEMALLKGVDRRKIIVKHAFPNSLSPIINVVVLNLAYLVVGVVVVEVVFVYPGLGQLMVDSVSKRDLPVVQACGFIFAATYIIMNLMADILARISNPRLLHG